MKYNPRYAPLPMKCQRCGKQGDTESVSSCIDFRLKSEFFSTISLKKWTKYCKGCEEEMREIIQAHIVNLDFSLFTGKESENK